MNPFKSFKEKIIEDYKKKIINENEDHLNSIRSEISESREAMTALLKDLQVKLRDIESEREKISFMEDEIKEKVKILESKTTPSWLWVEAFGMGFSKAWDMMMPIMTEGLIKAKKHIYSSAVDETINRMNRNGNKV